MGNFFAELKRRHIYRVAAAYAVIAWLLLQIVNNVVPIMLAPLWVGQFCLLLLALGFPLAIFFAWTREQPASDVTALRATVTDWALIGVLLIVMALVSYQEFSPPRTAVPAVRDVDAAREAAARPAGISVAVLPFVNLSSDKEQEFFSDGITEEITTALAKVPDLRVIGRTSAFQFKGQNKDLTSIGEALHATHLIEGSVRKAGDRVRITAQLIKADAGTHLWAENYDRELTDIFAIQEDIARAIATSLRMPLGLKPGENLVNNRSIDAESYQQFLRAKPLLIGGRNAANGIAILEPLVARNPNYAPAWERLAFGHLLAILSDRNNSGEEAKRVQETHRSQMEVAARRAIELDPNLPMALTWQGYMQARFQTGPRRLALYEDALSKALPLDPTNPDTLLWYSDLLLTLGRAKDAVAAKQQLHDEEPLVGLYAGHLARALWLDGQNENAIALAKDYSQNGVLAIIYTSLARYDEAADLLSKLPPPADAAVRLLRSLPQKTLPRDLPDLDQYSYIYVHAGAPERALQYFERPFRTPPEWLMLWHSSFAPVRKTERFKALVRKAEIVEYWRERGWPSFCHPTTGDDFECN